MPRGIFIVAVTNGLPNVPAAIFSGGDGCGWVRCGRTDGGKCLVMINASDAVFATLGAPLDAAAIKDLAASYGTTLDAIKHTWVGTIPITERIPPYEPPPAAKDSASLGISNLDMALLYADV